MAGATDPGAAWSALTGIVARVWWARSQARLACEE